jgi:Argonaute siRNA chaperone (ARC) complex subunit Arb1
MVLLATATIKNFLNYLLYHDVCPEYKENINAARISCDIAAKELWKNQQFIATGPGDFNKACSTLFGGYFDDLHIEDDRCEDGKEPSVQMANNVARKVVRFAIAGAGSDEQATRFLSFVMNNNELNAAKIEDIDGFEITDIVLPDDELREFYRTEAADLNVVGKLFGKSYRDPAKPEVDMSPSERKEWDDGETPSYEFEFFLEESLLQLCYPGMKILTSVWELNCGLYFFDEVFTTYCSIYTVLPNDVMLGWKNPRTILATDPPEAEEIGQVDTENML